MQSRATHTPNIEKVREAAFNAKGQDILVLPEYSGLLNKNANEVKNILFADSADPFIEECKNIAKDNNLWICLLYTSPSPRDRTRSRMPSSA